MTNEQVAAIVAACRKVIDAHERRNPDYERPTLRELRTIEGLLWTIMPTASDKRARESV